MVALDDLETRLAALERAVQNLPSTPTARTNCTPRRPHPSGLVYFRLASGGEYGCSVCGKTYYKDNSGGLRE